ncbi:UvrD-helicase domain-containing protein [bacterium]|nr:UvrD-helicase domain-containing protein [bacterium]
MNEQVEALNAMKEELATIVCKKPIGLPLHECFSRGGRTFCQNFGACKIEEKTFEQLRYVVQPIGINTFLDACPGSGKTEVVGLKAAREIKLWENNYSGIAILTFTNNATAVIRDRVIQFAGSESAGYPHYIGTIDSWLHRYIVHPFGHLITAYTGDDGDHSIKIVGTTSKAEFLEEYKTRYQYNRTGHIKGNEYFYDLRENRVVFISDSRPADNQRNNMELVKWQLDDLLKTKSKFLRDGYATYQDMEYLGYRILESPENMALIRNRFPNIIIDECQDLSGNQLKIFELLLEAGVSIHFVGDLQQSIYSFKGVYPDNIQAFADEKRFVPQMLTRNFRSFQDIVDLCDNLVGLDGTRGNPQEDGPPIVLYMTYIDELDMRNLPERFVDILSRHQINLDTSAILARNYTTISKIRAHGRPDQITNVSFIPPTAIQLWHTGGRTTEQTEEAFDLMGKFVSEAVFTEETHNVQKYYRPSSLYSNIAWRLFLAKILTSCCNHPDLSNLQQSWKNWARRFRENFAPIIQEAARDFGMPMPDEINISYKAPDNQGQVLVSDSLGYPNNPIAVDTRITTIHKIKGETLDATMLVSSPTNQGGGFWFRWLQDPTVEEARFAYVASSRPRKLIVWAIPENSLNDERIGRLNEIGFTQVN